MNIRNLCASAVLLLIATASCDSGNKNEPTPPPTPPSQETTYVAKGADISWLTEMEDKGVKFRYSSGKEGNCMEILKDKGVNAVRFRLWVDPENKYSSLADVLEKCKRAKELGFDIMIDLHYSDTWADPGKQTIPAAWQGLDLQQLKEKVSDYTHQTCLSLKEAGISPKWIQIGNETGNGMLWPEGKADTNPDGYVALNNAGYDAAKAVFPETKTIVHLQNGQDSSLFKWLFDILHSRGGKFDVIGMSLYPEPDNYIDYVNKTKANIKDCIARYNKPVMLCEVGMGESYTTQCLDFLNKCFKLTDEIPDRQFLGVFYWEPQCYNSWNGYNKGAFTSIGSPGTQLNAFSFIPSN